MNRIKRHSAYRSQSVVVEYRWHPLYGKRVPLFRRVGRGRDALVHIDVPAGMSRECPAWMCESSVCQAMPIGRPELSVEGLIELWRVLTHRAGNNTVGNERSSTSPPVVEESIDETKGKDNAKPTRLVARGRPAHPVAGAHKNRTDSGTGGSAHRSSSARSQKAIRGGRSR